VVGPTERNPSDAAIALQANMRCHRCSRVEEFVK
jgi:hypothetical protein